MSHAKGLRRCVVASLLLGAVPARGQLPSLTEFSFAQLDWFLPGGAPVQANSLWGQFRYSYEAPSLTGYLNVSIAHPSGGAASWAVQNLPLWAAGTGRAGLRQELVHLDLGALGLTAGDDWTDLVFGYTIDPTIRAVAPTPTTAATAGDQVQRAGDQPSEPPVPGPFTDPGRPQPVDFGGGVPDRFGLARDMERVQEDDFFCFTGSMARSLAWLNHEHGLGINRTGQDIYRDLVARGTSRSPIPGARAPYRDEWIGYKDRYAREASDGRIETKVWDPGGMVDPVRGVREQDGSLEEWLVAEFLRGEDIELAYYYPGNAHIVTIVDLYRGTDGFLRVDYRDDEVQNDPAAGDEAVKRGRKIYRDAAGDYHFGADRNTIYFAVSESVVPEPGTFVLAATGVLALGVLVRRRRTR